MFFLIVATLLSLSIRSFAQVVVRPAASDLPPETEIWEGGVTQDSQGEWKYLKGAAEVRTTEMTITADEIDFNQDTAWAYARGHVKLQHYATGDIVNADHAEYNLKTEEGKFYVVNGTSPAKIMTSPGILTTSNPFYFQGKWADRIKNRFILHQGFITDCKVPKPWWKFEAPVFDIVPGQRAIARHAVFRLQHVPILYLPYFYRPLGRNTRQSGFLTPNFGHSTTRGYLYGGGYYWAINRSYDMAYTLQYYTLRGPAHSFDFRGKPNAATDFNFNLYGVQDKGVPTGLINNGQNQGGLEFEFTGRTRILGFTGQIDYTYLSSFLFRAAFTYNISPQVTSIGFLTRHFKDDIYALNFVFQREESSFSILTKGEQVILQKLPMAEVSGRSREIVHGKLPVWFSFGASGGLLSRSEPILTSALTYSGTLDTGFLMARSDFKPTVSTAFSFKGFSLYPSFSFEGTAYSRDYSSNNQSAVTIATANLFRKDTDFVVDFRPPALERTYTPPKWLHLGTKVRHVIETEAEYQKVSGVADFQKAIHFDGTDIVSNTNQVTIGITNRLYKKDKNGDVKEFVTWRVREAHYFDPTFGGAVLPNQRNVILSQELLTPYTFLNGPRSYSPIVSSLTVSPYSFFGLEYRASYDPRKDQRKFVDHTIGGSFRWRRYFTNFGETSITANPLLVTPSNQLIYGGGMGSNNGRGYNAAATVFYDLLLQRVTFSLYQVTYNTDCCGFSVQLRRVNNIVRNDNQYLFSFAIANIGQFGSLQKQSRIF